MGGQTGIQAGPTMVAAMAVLPTLVVIMAAGPMNQLRACLDRLLMFLGLSKAAYGVARAGAARAIFWTCRSAWDL